MKYVSSPYLLYDESVHHGNDAPTTAVYYYKIEKWCIPLYRLSIFLQSSSAETCIIYIYIYDKHFWINIGLGAGAHRRWAPSMRSTTRHRQNKQTHMTKQKINAMKTLLNIQIMYCGNWIIYFAINSIHKWCTSALYTHILGAINMLTESRSKWKKLLWRNTQQAAFTQCVYFDFCFLFHSLRQSFGFFVLCGDMWGFVLFDEGCREWVTGRNRQFKRYIGGSLSAF